MDKQRQQKLEQRAISFSVFGAAVDNVQQLDAIRDRIAARLAPMEQQGRLIWLNTMFTADRDWVFA